MHQQLPKGVYQFIRLFLQPHRWAIGALIVCAIVSGTYSTVNAYLTKVLIDFVSMPSSQGVNLLSALLWPAVFFIINFEVHNLSWRAIQYIKLKAGPDIQNQIIRNMFAYTEKNSFQFFQDNFSGTIASNIKSIADNIFDMLINLAPHVIRQLTRIILTLITMYFINPIFCIAFALSVIIFF